MRFLSRFEVVNLRAAPNLCYFHSMAQHPRFIDISGQRFGSWTATEQAGYRRDGGGAQWRVRCDCGTEGVRSSAGLRGGETKSCGCTANESNRLRHTTHGGRGTRLYSIWRGMRARCHNTNDAAFKHYGGRGISIAPEWAAFEVFRDWAHANSYAENLTIERVDSDGNYEPANCVWADWTVQSRNRRGVHRAPDGTPWVEIAARNGIHPKTYNWRTKLGWTYEEAVTIPMGMRRKTARKLNLPSSLSKSPA